jgi:hypothetical protein
MGLSNDTIFLLLVVVLLLLLRHPNWELGLEKDSFPSYIKIGYEGSSFPEEILNPKKIQQFKKIQLDFNNRRHWGCGLSRQTFHNLCRIFLCTSSLVNGIVK